MNITLYKQWKHIIILIILACLYQTGMAQASKERKLILGTWVSEDHSARYEFKTNGECRVSFPMSKTIDIYRYRITDTIPACKPVESAIDPAEKPSFLEMVNKKSRVKLCYEINGFTAKTLSIRPLGRGGYLLFKRVK